MAIEVILEIIIPLLMANLIDDGIYGGEMNMVYKNRHRIGFMCYSFFNIWYAIW